MPGQRKRCDELRLPARDQGHHLQPASLSARLVHHIGQRPLRMQHNERRVDARNYPLHLNASVGADVHNV